MSAPTSYCCSSAALGLPHDTNCPARDGAIAGALGFVRVVERSEAFDRREAEVRRKYEAAQAKARRERIATAVMAGFAANPDDSAAGTAALAVKWADALIAELDK